MPSSSFPPGVPLVCYVTDRRAFECAEPEAAARLLESFAQAAAAGIDAIQLREKDLSARDLLELARAALARLRAVPSVDRRGAVPKPPHRAPLLRDPSGQPRLIVNDRLDVALAAGADGIHLGAESVSVADVAKFRAAGRLPANFLIGRSCHSLDEAAQVEQDGADYISFGPVFATPSKARFGPPQGTDALAAICRRVRIPVLAIGGITLDNAASCIAAGAAGIAAIRLFQESDNLPAVLRSLKHARIL